MVVHFQGTRASGEAEADHAHMSSAMRHGTLQHSLFEVFDQRKHADLPSAVVMKKPFLSFFR